MNEEILVPILGMGLVLAFAAPFFALPIILVKIYRKRQAAKEKDRLESQPQTIQAESWLPQPSIFSLLVIVWGMMTGFAVGMFSHLLYIVFILALVMGINGGKMIVDVVQRARLRQTSQLLFLSLLSAVSMYAAFHYTRYLGFQVQASLEIYSDFSEAIDGENLAVTKAFLDYALEEETGHSGFLGYMLYRANEGVSIGRLARSSSFNLGPLLTWLYWLLEFGIIFGMTIQKGRKAISERVCEACGSPYGGEKHLGGTTLANVHLLLELIRDKDFTRLGTLMEKNAELPSVEVYLQGCKVCGKSPSQLVVRHAFQSGKGGLRFQDTLQTTLLPAESAQLLSQVSFSGD
jgi:hypothetical protein